MSFRINRIYTRSGDSGDTALIGGVRVKKNDLRVVAYGAVDELSCFLGLVLADLAPKEQILIDELLLVQQELFDLGSELAVGSGERRAKISPTQIERLEARCDSFCDGIPELTSFILPGGDDAIARLHVARSVCRRAEREVVQLAVSDTVSETALSYLNRLSDLLFAATRWLHHQRGIPEVLWDQNTRR